MGEHEPGNLNAVPKSLCPLPPSKTQLSRLPPPHHFLQVLNGQTSSCGGLTLIPIASELPDVHSSWGSSSCPQRGILTPNEGPLKKAARSPPKEGPLKKAARSIALQDRAGLWIHSHLPRHPPSPTTPNLPETSIKRGYLPPAQNPLCPSAHMTLP